MNNQIDSSYEGDLHTIASEVPRGRPVKPEQAITVELGPYKIDLALIQYFSIFGILDGLACTNDTFATRQSRQQMIQKIYMRLSNKIKIDYLTVEQILVFVNHVTLSADFIFLDEYATLIFWVFISFNFENDQQINQFALQFLKASKVLSLQCFLQEYENKKKRGTKTKPISKQHRNQEITKIKQKFTKNWDNYRKKNKSQMSEKFFLKLKNKQVIQTVFIEFFWKIREQVFEFMRKPQPLISQLKLMDEMLKEILKE